MLRAVGIQPDGFVGHSTGEIGCAYVDGALTAEQAMLCAYWARTLHRGGLTREQAEARCRDGVEIACYNAHDSVTLSGPVDAVAHLVEELRVENVFAKEVDSLDVPFHSSHVRDVGAPLTDALRKVR
ncbi:hypothetical protein HPB48_023481 [Haemaphysalis longicornis]|uniref:Malonyl-CoA:ACP transacylase (MAT) domain-containing protein n=1 Tax=Haemaphysalis longicornis TaxID=44386 RepID=A0A9J6GWK5_HAELO|nr:hypothetical protein HPB48_023481 [Haemaphysalis longicornis]